MVDEVLPWDFRVRFGILSQGAFTIGPDSAFVNTQPKVLCEICRLGLVKPWPWGVLDKSSNVPILDP